MLQTVILLLKGLAGHNCVLLGFEELQPGVIHVNFSGLDVVGPKDAHAAPQRGLVQVCCVFMLLVEDQELCHDTVDVDVKGVIRPPVVVEDLERERESLLSLLELAGHVLGLHEDALELDGFGVHQ